MMGFTATATATLLAAFFNLVSWRHRRRDDVLGSEVNDPSWGGVDGRAKVDVIVIGAGVAGCAISYALSKVQENITILIFSKSITILIIPKEDMSPVNFQ
jgi:CO dehydrogenase/acetyl-CoA synthase epsilon subunit